MIERTKSVMQAANVLRQHVPILVEQYLDELPQEADHRFEESWYDDLQQKVNDLFDELMGLCGRFDQDRKSEATGTPWRTETPREDAAAINNPTPEGREEIRQLKREVKSLRIQLAAIMANSQAEAEKPLERLHEIDEQLGTAYAQQYR
jgi:hypothetical protein